MSTKPISPKEALDTCVLMPDFVIDAVNYCIKKYYRGKQFNISQRELMNCMKSSSSQLDALSNAEIIKNGYLNFEKVYEVRGGKLHMSKMM